MKRFVWGILNFQIVKCFSSLKIDRCELEETLKIGNCGIEQLNSNFGKLPTLEKMQKTSLFHFN